MHHGLMLEILKSIISIGALCLINLKLGLVVMAWCLAYMLVMYKFSVKLNQLSFEETESRHTISGQISDMISNIISLFSFTTRQKELKNLRISIQNDYIPKQIRTSKYDFKSSIVHGAFAS
jgi:ABC-type multidrug transport system fused ATPase/permease subunit